MAKMLYNVTWKGEPPSLQEVCDKYGFRPEEVDAEFGVIAIDPDDNLYAIRVERGAALRTQGRESPVKDELQGPFSDPLIEPFGPPVPPSREGDGSEGGGGQE